MYSAGIVSPNYFAAVQNRGERRGFDPVRSPGLGCDMREPAVRNEMQLIRTPDPNPALRTGSSFASRTPARAESLTSHLTLPRTVTLRVESCLVAIGQRECEQKMFIRTRSHRSVTLHFQVIVK